MSNECISLKDYDVGSIIKKRVNCTVTLLDRDNPSTSDNYIEFYSDYGTSNWFKITNLKLEIGDKATDYTLAPEDVDSAISIAQNTATDITNRVNDKENHYNFKYHTDITVYGDTNKFYPVIIKHGDQDVKRSIMVKRAYSEKAPSDWNTSTHKGGLTLKILTNFGNWRRSQLFLANR